MEASSQSFELRYEDGDVVIARHYGLIGEEYDISWMMLEHGPRSGECVSFLLLFYSILLVCSSWQLQ